jgi:hypothetical protein
MCWRGPTIPAAAVDLFAAAAGAGVQPVVGRAANSAFETFIAQPRLDVEQVEELEHFI